MAPEWRIAPIPKDFPMGTQSMQNRDKARKEKYRQQKHRETIERLYPEIVIENRGIAKGDLAGLIAAQFTRFAIHEGRKAPPGWDLCREFLKDLVKGEIATDSRSVAHCCTLIGDFLLATLGEETVANFLPAEGFRICVSQSRKLFVVIQKLLGVKDARGSLVWSSFTRKKLCVDGHEMDIYFTDHALQRVVQRFLGEKLNSYHKIEALYLLLHFAPATVERYQGQLFLSLFAPCDWFHKGHAKQWEGGGLDFSALNLPDLLPQPVPKETKRSGETKPLMMVRAMRFPAELVGSRIILKTALLPGQDGTPEMKLRDYPSPLGETEKLLFRELDKVFPDPTSAEYGRLLLLMHQSGHPQFTKARMDLPNIYWVEGEFDLFDRVCA